MFLNEKNLLQFSVVFAWVGRRQCSVTNKQQPGKKTNVLLMTILKGWTVGTMGVMIISIILSKNNNNSNMEKFII